MGWAWVALALPGITRLGWTGRRALEPLVVSDGEDISGIKVYESMAVATR